MSEAMIAMLFIVMLLPSTTIRIETKCFQYEYSAKKMYGFHKKIILRIWKHLS